MIKRALGLWGGEASDSDVDSDDALTEKQKKRLEKRLLPGDGFGDEDDSSDDGEGDGEGEESEGDMPVRPQARREEGTKFRGNYHCKLCPEKIILNEKDLAAHLQSSEHKKMEKRFEYAKALGPEAYEAECRERVRAKADAERRAASGELSKRQLKKQQRKKNLLKKRSLKRKSGAERAKNLSDDQIQARKLKCQEKQARKLARRQAAQEHPRPQVTASECGLPKVKRRQQT